MRVPYPMSNTHPVFTLVGVPIFCPVTSPIKILIFDGVHPKANLWRLPSISHPVAPDRHRKAVPWSSRRRILRLWKPSLRAKKISLWEIDKYIDLMPLELLKLPHPLAHQWAWHPLPWGRVYSTPIKGLHKNPFHGCSLASLVGAQKLFL